MSGVEWCCHAFERNSTTTLFPNALRMGKDKPGEHNDTELLWYRLNALCTQLEEMLREAPDHVEPRMHLRVLDVLNTSLGGPDWRAKRRELPF